VRAIFKPSAPSSASVIWYPLRSRRRESMSRFISLSSTSKILAITKNLYHCRDSRSNILRHFNHITQKIVYFIEQLLSRISALLQNLNHVAIQTPPILIRQIFRGYYHHGYVPVFRLTP